MYKITFVLMFLFLSAQVVFCQNFDAMGVSEDLQEAVLRDTTTGEEWVVRKRDMVDGWIVLDIAHTHVTIGGRIEGGRAIATNLPVRARVRPTVESP